MVAVLREYAGRIRDQVSGLAVHQSHRGGGQVRQVADGRHRLAQPGRPEPRFGLPERPDDWRLAHYFQPARRDYHAAGHGFGLYRHQGIAHGEQHYGHPESWRGTAGDCGRGVLHQARQLDTLRAQWCQGCAERRGGGFLRFHRLRLHLDYRRGMQRPAA